jgi:hypothetical protein
MPHGALRLHQVVVHDEAVLTLLPPQKVHWALAYLQEQFNQASSAGA